MEGLGVWEMDRGRPYCRRDGRTDGWQRTGDSSSQRDLRNREWTTERRWKRKESLGNETERNLKDSTRSLE